MTAPTHVANVSSLFLIVDITFFSICADLFKIEHIEIEGNDRRVVIKCPVLGEHFKVVGDCNYQVKVKDCPTKVCLLYAIR